MVLWRVSSQSCRSFIFLLVSVSACLVAEAAEYPLYRSEDGGGSWMRSDAGLPGDARMNALAEGGGTMVVGTDAGIFVSEDSGKGWKKAELAGAKSRRMVALASAGGSFFAAGENVLLVSSDGGKSWVASEGFPRKVVRCLFAHGGVVYAGMDADGIYRSMDFGGDVGAGGGWDAGEFAGAGVRGGG